MNGKFIADIWQFPFLRRRTPPHPLFQQDGHGERGGNQQNHAKSSYRHSPQLTIASTTAITMGRPHPART